MLPPQRPAGCSPAEASAALLSPHQCSPMTYHHGRVDEKQRGFVLQTSHDHPYQRYPCLLRNREGEECRLSHGRSLTTCHNPPQSSRADIPALTPITSPTCHLHPKPLLWPMSSLLRTVKMTMQICQFTASASTLAHESPLHLLALRRRLDALARCTMSPGHVRQRLVRKASICLSTSQHRPQPAPQLRRRRPYSHHRLLLVNLHLSHLHI